MRLRKFYLVFVLLLLTAKAAGSVSNARNSAKECPMVKIEAERLPDLNIARAGHQTLLVNGEITIFGGHTKGFVPTPTAEYFSNGKWHEMNTVYTHDNGIAVKLDNDDVLLAGGHDRNLGIGQSFEVEMYYPLSHTFEGFGCLDQKRAIATGALLDNGQVVISGNWYGKDGIELYNLNSRQFSHLKETSTNRSFVHILRTANDDALIFSTTDEQGQSGGEVIADRLKGESFHVPILNNWKSAVFPHHCEDGFIGDASKDDYTYLMVATNDEGQLGIFVVHDTIFTHLQTSTPLPTIGLSGETIVYYPNIIVNRKTGLGYVICTASSNRYYVLAIDYTKRPAPITLYYTDPLDETHAISGCNPILTAEGDLFFCGGISDNNYKPLASALVLRVATSMNAANRPLWPWILAMVLSITIGCIVVMLFKRLRDGVPHSVSEIKPRMSVQEDATSEDLMVQICQLMDDQKLFLNSNLKVEDVASELGVHRNAVSACIGQQRGYSFAQLVRNYRIEHAKQLLREHPDMKMTIVGLESGFSHERSFFRAFKAITGVTPSEWMSQRKND